MKVSQRIFNSEAKDLLDSESSEYSLYFSKEKNIVKRCSLIKPSTPKTKLMDAMNSPHSLQKNSSLNISNDLSRRMSSVSPQSANAFIPNFNLVKNSACGYMKEDKGCSSEESFSSDEAEFHGRKAINANVSQFAKAKTRRISKKEERQVMFKPFQDLKTENYDKMSTMTPMHRAKTYFAKENEIEKEKASFRPRKSNDSILTSQKHSISRRREVSVVSTQSLKQYKTKKNKKMINQYKVVKNLGQGSYATVKLCADQVSGHCFALK